MGKIFFLIQKHRLNIFKQSENRQGRCVADKLWPRIVMAR